MTCTRPLGTEWHFGCSVANMSIRKPGAESDVEPLPEVVLDANILCSDYALQSVPYRLIAHLEPGWLNFHTPAVVIEEVVARRADDASAKRSAALQKLQEARRHGFSIPHVEIDDIDYRAYLTHRLNEDLSISTLPWPRTDHEHLAMKAANRTPPFDSKGGGYRDALVWESVLDLLRDGNEIIALVSNDRPAFAMGSTLHPVLQAEAAALGGSVELVQDFKTWLLSKVPWAGTVTLDDAVDQALHTEFLSFFYSSDLQEALYPDVSDMRFSAQPLRFDVVDVDLWDGPEPTRRVVQEHGFLLWEYDVGYRARFTAEFSTPPAHVPAGAQVEALPYGQVVVSGTVSMIATIAVLHGDGSQFEIDKVSWTLGEEPGAEAIVEALFERLDTNFMTLATADLPIDPEAVHGVNSVVRVLTMRDIISEEFGSALPRDLQYPLELRVESKSTLWCRRSEVIAHRQNDA